MGQETIKVHTVVLPTTQGCSQCAECDVDMLSGNNDVFYMKPSKFLFL